MLRGWSHPEYLKCSFFSDQVEYLRHIIQPGTYRWDLGLHKIQEGQGKTFADVLSRLHTTVETEAGYEDDTPSLHITHPTRATVTILDVDVPGYEEPDELP